jgi:integrase
MKMKRNISRANLIRRKIKTQSAPEPERQVTVAEWTMEWYQNYKAIKHASTTRQVQMVYIKHHIIPHLGNLLLHKVQTIDIQKFINFLSSQGNCSKLKHSVTVGNPLAPWTIKKIRALLMASFDAAIRHGLIEKNPVRDTEPIPVQSLNVAHFTPEQQEIFLNGTKRHRFHTAYKLLFYTGCRRSEILGLTWDCVDFNSSQINIRQVLVNIDGKPLLKNYPKTKSSVRTIPLHPELSKLLKQHYKNQINESKKYPDWNNPYKLVFTNKDGSPHSPTYFLHNFKNAIKKLGLPKNLRVHSTRHTFATNLLQLGVAISDVQHLGGWSDTRVVLEIYSHAVQASHRSAVELLYNPTKKRKR